MAVEVSKMADAMKVEELEAESSGRVDGGGGLVRRACKPKKAVWANVPKKQLAMMSIEEKESLECYQGGLLQALGEGLGRWEWRNPHSLGLVTATASSGACGHVREIVAPHLGSFMTEDIPESAWLAVDLCGMEALPSTMR